jgi:mono/diheme cytochrome c family protein
MPKLITAVLMAGLASPSIFAFTQQPTPTIKMVPIKPTSPVSGQQMYASYCASCHGTAGVGNGPAAPAMKTQPTNLTTLSKKNGGTFPAAHIQTVLQFGIENNSHGSVEMPVWGDLLLTLHGSGPNNGMVVHQRIGNLTQYLKQMQQ